MGIQTFPKDIRPKVNVLERLEFELAYYDFAAQCFNHCFTDKYCKVLLV